MRTHLIRLLVVAVVAIMAAGAASPATADPAPMQAPTETAMRQAMIDAGDWMLTVVGTDGQMTAPFGSPAWEESSAVTPQRF